MAKNNNLAYALRNFETQESEKKIKPKIKKLEKTGEKQAYKNKHAFRMALGMFYVVALCGALLLARTQLIKENNEMLEAQKTLMSVDSSYERLSLEVDSVSSLKAIEQKAIEEYGMVKPDQNQISYVKVEKSNKIRIKDEQNDIISAITGFLNQIKEYIGG